MSALRVGAVAFAIVLAAACGNDERHTGGTGALTTGPSSGPGSGGGGSGGAGGAGGVGGAGGGGGADCPSCADKLDDTGGIIQASDLCGYDEMAMTCNPVSSCQLWVNLQGCLCGDLMVPGNCEIECTFTCLGVASDTPGCATCRTSLCGPEETNCLADTGSG